MTELEYVKRMLTAGDYRFLLCKGEIVYTGEGNTTPELLETVKLQEDWKEGYCAAAEFGKADALLSVLLGLSGVYAQLMTKSALRVLEKHGIAYEYRSLTPHLLNEGKTGLVPTEQAVRDIDDPQEALRVLTA